MVAGRKQQQICSGEKAIARKHQAISFELLQHGKKIGDCRYELTIPCKNDTDLGEKIYRLLNDISNEADLRHCFIEADVREKGTERSW